MGPRFTLFLIAALSPCEKRQWPTASHFWPSFVWKWMTSTQVHRPAEQGFLLVASCQTMLLGSQSGGLYHFSGSIIRTVTFRFSFLFVYCACILMPYGSCTYELSRLYRIALIFRGSLFSRHSRKFFQQNFWDSAHHVSQSTITRASWHSTPLAERERVK